MTQTLAVPPASRPGNSIAWALQCLLALIFFAAAGAKLAGVPMMVQIFDKIGLGQGLRYVTGVVEIVGAIALLAPGFAGPGAVWLGFTMICAVGIHIAILHGGAAPAVLLVALNAVVAWLRRDQIAAVIGRLLG